MAEDEWTPDLDALRYGVTVTEEPTLPSESDDIELRQAIHKMRTDWMKDDPVYHETYKALFPSEPKKRASRKR